MGPESERLRAHFNSKIVNNYITRLLAAPTTGPGGHLLQDANQRGHEPRRPIVGDRGAEDIRYTRSRSKRRVLVRLEEYDLTNVWLSS